MGIRFGHNSTIFWPTELKLFVGIKESIIYKLPLRNQCYAAQFIISMATISAPQNPTKNVARVSLILGYLLSQNCVPKVSDLGSLPLKT